MTPGVGGGAAFRQPRVSRAQGRGWQRSGHPQGMEDTVPAVRGVGVGTRPELRPQRWGDLGAV